MNREPWICPKCGRTLTVRNQEHTCGLSDLEHHFERKDPIGRVAFDWICSILNNAGPYEVLPMKTMIVFAQGVNLISLKTRRAGVLVEFLLSRPLDSPRVKNELAYSRTKTAYTIPVEEESELDEELKAWILEAYETGAR